MTTLPSIDSLWNFNDPQATEAVLRDWLDKTDDAVFRLQLQTQIARTYSLRRMFDEAHQLLDTLEPQITTAPLVEIRYLLERGRTYNSSKKSADALPLFEKAWEVAQSARAHNLAVDAAHMVAIAKTESKDQLAWNRKALDYAEKFGVDRWKASLNNNIGWTLHDMEKYDEALEAFKQALHWRNEQGDPDLIRIAKWCIGRTLRSLGKLDEALLVQKSLLDDNGDGFVHEEMGEVLHALGRTDEAKPYFKQAHTALSEMGWIAPERLDRLKTLGR